MPLKCLDDGRSVFAFDIADPAAWEELRAQNKRRRHLKMHCCNADVTLRTSKLGTRHFAHARVGLCTTKPESAEHLLAKSIIVNCARQQGWTLQTEQAGQCADGDHWIADVLATKEGSRPVAFEVQWSRQTDEQTRYRQLRYERSNVRGLWLFRQFDFPVSKDTPAFRLIYNEAKRDFSVGIPSPSYNHYVSRRDINESRYWQQIIPLSKFVTGALTGGLKFAPALNATVPATIWTTEKFCYKCGCETKIVHCIKLDIDEIFPGHATDELSIYDFDEWAGGRKMLSSLMPKDFLLAHNIGEVKPRFGGWSKSPMISNGCAHCEGLHGFMHDLDDIGTLAAGPKIGVTLAPSWTQHFPSIAETLDRWWFQEDAG